VRQTSSSELSQLQQRVPVAAGDEVAVVAEAVVADAVRRLEHLQAERLQHQLVAHQHRPEPELRTRVADVVVAAVMPFPRFADRRLNHGFHFCRGQQRSTTTTRRTR
jgi:hypothetical protein